MTRIDSLLAEFTRETTTARTHLERLPADQFDWRPHAKSFTALSHLVHHRGQSSVYLRLLDVPVPGSYGPTADDHW